MRKNQPSGVVVSTPGSTTRRWIEFSDINWLLVFVLYTLGGLIAAGTIFTSGRAEGGHQPYYLPLLWEITGYWTAFTLLPVMILGFARLPITRANWFWACPAHLLISIAVGVTHTFFMLVSRRVLYDLFGLGEYNYGHMGYRLLMEYHKQFIHYWTVYIVLRAIAYYRRSREQERAAAALELRTSELQRQLAQAQLQALRSQLNPHFLFNTLNMISSVMYDDVDRADHMIAALSRMLRMSLEEHVGPQVPLRRELEFVEAAVELIRARFQDQVNIDIEAAPDTLDCMVPAMLLHTFIENAIKHHHGGEDSTISVRVRLERDAHNLHLHVVDNGPGIDNVGSAVGRGVGLANSRQRLQALYGDGFKFDLDNRPEGGLHAHIAIPATSAPALQPA